MEYAFGLELERKVYHPAAPAAAAGYAAAFPFSYVRSGSDSPYPALQRENSQRQCRC